MRAALRLMLAGAALALAHVAWSQAAHGPAHHPSDGGFKGFAIMGDNPLTAGETAALLAPFLRQEATSEVLDQAATRLERALHDRGYALYQVVLPSQTMSDTITLHVRRRTVSRVVIEGGGEGEGPHFDEASLRAALPELQEKSSPNTHRLAREVAIANGNPSRRLAVDWQPDAAPDTLTALVRLRAIRPWSLAAGWNNSGTRETGRDRLSLGASHHNLFGRGQVLSAVITTSPDRPSRVSQAGLGFQAPLPSWGGVVLAHHFRSDVAGRFGVDRPDRGHPGFDATGPGWETRCGYTHHFASRPGRRSHLLLTLDDRRLEASDLAGQPQATALRRSRPVAIGYATDRETAGMAWGYHVAFAANLPYGEGNELAAYRTENAEIETHHWKAWRASLHTSTEWRGGWQWAGRIRAQYSPDLLLAAEAFGLGGPDSVRGVPERVLYGDSGLSATLEGSTPLLWQGLRLLAFVDAGLVRSDLTDSPARPRKDRLASVGVGLRYGHASGARLSADYGRVITGSRADPGANPVAPSQGDDKLHVNVSLAF
jgi:hemolysin activation/secretion protein